MTTPPTSGVGSVPASVTAAIAAAKAAAAAAAESPVAAAVTAAAPRAGTNTNAVHPRPGTATGTAPVPDESAHVAGVGAAEAEADAAAAVAAMELEIATRISVSSSGSAGVGGGVSYFKPETEMGGAGVLDGTRRIVLQESEPRTVAIELRSKHDVRPRLIADNAAVLNDWLVNSCGVGGLSGLFVRAGRLIRVSSIGDEGYNLEAGSGSSQIDFMTDKQLQGLVQSRYWPYVEKRVEGADKEGNLEVFFYRKQALIPQNVCDIAVQNAAGLANTPEVVGVTHTPQIRVNGTLLNEPGYDAESRMLYLPDSDYVPFFIPALGSVSDDWVEWSRYTLAYVLKDFPFVTEQHRMNMYALMITPILRQMIPAPYPMFAISATQRGTGKSLLAKVLIALHGGLHRPPLQNDDEEIRKQITSVLTTTTAPIVNFDNVDSVLSSPVLANLLTARVWTDRPLNRTATVEAPNDRLWIATGNNVQIGGDLARRVNWIKLDAGVEKPEFRTGFDEKDLVGYVESNRGSIIAALLIQVLAWVQKGSAVAEIRSDDYARWAGSMAEILNGGGLDPSGAFAAGAAEEEQEMSGDEAELAMLLSAINEIYPGGAAWQVRDLKEYGIGEHGIVPQENLLNALPMRCAGARDPWRSLGHYLSKREGQFAGGMRVQKAPSGVRGGVAWQLVGAPPAAE